MVNSKNNIMSRTKIFQFIILINAVNNIIAGAALLIAPQAFYSFADFAPFNRHYMGDVGAFLLPLGIGLLAAVRAPYDHRSLIGVAALGNILHVINHLYDDLIIERGISIHWLTNTVPLMILGVALLIVYLDLIRHRLYNRPDGSPQSL